MINFIHRWLQHRGGNIALTTALMAVPVIGLIGFAIDYSQMTGTRDQLQRAADEAVIAAVARSQAYDLSDTTAAKASANAAMESTFRAAVKTFQSTNVSFTTDVQIVKGEAQAKLTYKAAYATSMSQILNIGTMTVSGQARASSARQAYIDFYVLVDTSGSMGTGATAEDQAKMQAAINCTVACHANPTSTNVSKAHAVGAQLQIDVVRNALSKLVLSQANRQIVPKQFGYTVYSFSSRPTLVLSRTTDASVASGAIAALGLDTATRGMGTNFDTALDALAAAIPQSGDGSSPGKPIVYVLLVTDGIGNSTYQVPGALGLVPEPDGTPSLDPLFIRRSPWQQFDVGYQETLAGFNSDKCMPLKTKGVTVMTIKIDYRQTDSSRPETSYANNQLNANTRGNLIKCASRASLAYTAQSPDEFQTAASKLFYEAGAKAQLTQ